MYNTFQGQINLTLHGCKTHFKVKSIILHWLYRTTHFKVKSIILHWLYNTFQGRINHLTMGVQHISRSNQSSYTGCKTHFKVKSIILHWLYSTTHFKVKSIILHWLYNTFQGHISHLTLVVQHISRSHQSSYTGCTTQFMLKSIFLQCTTYSRVKSIILQWSCSTFHVQINCLTIYNCLTLAVKCFFVN